MSNLCRLPAHILPPPPPNPFLQIIISLSLSRLSTWFRSHYHTSPPGCSLIITPLRLVALSLSHLHLVALSLSLWDSMRCSPPHLAPFQPVCLSVSDLSLPTGRECNTHLRATNTLSLYLSGEKGDRIRDGERDNENKREKKRSEGEEERDKEGEKE